MNHHNTTADATLHFFAGQLLLEYKDSKGAIIKKCISPQAARAAFATEPIDSDWLPPHTCRYGEGPKGTWIMLKFEPASYEVLLADPLTVTGHTEPLRALSIPLPGLLMLGIERHYFLWAFKAWKDNSTTLYEVPLPNVHPNGAVCFGNATTPIASGKTIQKAWSLFWESHFSNELTSGKSRRQRENILLLLGELHYDQARTYPFDDLVRTRMTLAKIIEQVTQARGDDPYDT